MKLENIETDCKAMTVWHISVTNPIPVVPNVSLENGFQFIKVKCTYLEYYLDLDL